MSYTLTKSGKCGEEAFYELEFTTKTLTIKGSGAIFDYIKTDENHRRIKPDYYCFRKNIKHIVIEKGITRIGAYAFEDCFNLVDVKAPEGIDVIGKHAFSNCTALKSYEFKEGLKGVERCAFYGCRSLKEAEFPESMYIIEAHAFEKCSALSYLCFKRKGVVILHPYAFAQSGVKALRFESETVDIEDFAFFNCTSLKHVYAYKGEYSVYCGAFSGCKNLVSVYLNGNLSRLESSAFENCTKLKLASLRGTIKAIDSRTFANCKKLHVLWIPETVERVTAGAFENCNKIENVNFGAGREEWKKLDIEEGNDCLNRATVYYDFKVLFDENTIIDD